MHTTLGLGFVEPPQTVFPGSPCRLGSCNSSFSTAPPPQHAKRAQGATQASTMLRSSAAAFTPGETVHQTPIKTTGAAAAAADEDEELCAWLQQKVSLTQRVVDKVLPSEQGC